MKLCQGIQEAQHFHQQLELLYVIEGMLYVYQDEETYELKKHDIIVINSNNAHQLSSVSNSAILRIYITFQVLEELISDDNFVFSCNSVADHIHSYDELHSVIHQILFTYVGTQKKTEALRWGYVYQLLDILIEQFRLETNDADTAKERLQRIINYVNQNFQEQINLGRLAEQMFTSTSSLSRLFKKNMGCYFGDFVNQVRLNYAIHELTDTDKTVTKIAMDCGFASLAAFNKQFQNTFGMSPTAYRKQKENEELQQGTQLLWAEVAEDIKRLKQETELLSQPEEKHSLLEIQSQTGVEYKRSWNQILNAGSAYGMGVGNIQNHISLLYEQLQFRYVRIWNLFSERLLIRPNIHSRQYNFNMLDNVLDFMVNHRMIPYLDFGERPVCAVEAEGKVVYYDEEYMLFESADDWFRVFESFLQHVIRRYGRENVSQWIFDFTIDIRFGRWKCCADELETCQLYARIYQHIKRNLPNAMVGGIGAAPNTDMNQMIYWLQFSKAHECVPDFISIVVFPYFSNNHFLKEENQPNLVKRSGKVHDEIRQIRQSRELLDIHGLDNCKLFVSEWNHTLSTRSWLNESCFRGCYMINTINYTWDGVDAMGVWMGSDWCNSYYDTLRIANGGNGMLTQDGIRKPAYHALAFLNRMHSRLVQRGENYIVTTNGMNSYYILCYNFKNYSYQFFCEEENELDIHNLAPLFENTEPIQMKIVITGLADNRRFFIKKRDINEEHGSLLAEWGRFDFEANLQEQDIEYLQNVCVPELSLWKQVTNKGKLEFRTELKAHEIILYHVYEDRV